MPPDKKLDMVQYNQLVDILQGDDNQILFKENESCFLETPISSWKNKLDELKSMASIQDVSSVLEKIKLFTTKYGPLPSGSEKDLMKEQQF